MTGAVLWAALIAALVTALMAAAARGVGWIDRRDGLEERKPREQPVPVVGGGAIRGRGSPARSLTVEAGLVSFPGPPSPARSSSASWTTCCREA